ncbi:hypothetical protein J2Z40_002168 [Cytobacillus eiseniae]|uniref:Uncharacterized protein n=1 Tax=Cytobacillus eiseniae TaxID=762947 RepID=A0ABS4RGW1_9BACI|nr:hypothetical protein [Cytobacillus eiseniae]
MFSTTVEGNGALEWRRNVIFLGGHLVGLKQSYTVYKKDVPEFATLRYFTNGVSIIQQEGDI